MIVVDTSVWASALLSRDAHFAQSTEWLDFSILIGQEMHFPMIVIPELAGALARSGVPVPIIADEIGKLGERPTTQLHELDFTLALLSARVASSTSMKGADAVLLRWQRDSMSRL